MKFLIAIALFGILLACSATAKQYSTVYADQYSNAAVAQQSSGSTIASNQVLGGGWGAPLGASNLYANQYSNSYAAQASSGSTLAATTVAPGLGYGYGVGYPGYGYGIGYPGYGYGVGYPGYGYGVGYPVYGGYPGYGIYY